MSGANHSTSIPRARRGLAVTLALLLMTALGCSAPEPETETSTVQLGQTTPPPPDSPTAGWASPSSSPAPSRVATPTLQQSPTTSSITARPSSGSTSGGRTTPLSPRTTAIATSAVVGGSSRRGGCSTSTTICVGRGQTAQTLAQALTKANDGAIIELLPGTYHETVVVTHNVTIRSNPIDPAVISCAGLRPAQDKACIVAAGSALVVESLKVTGAKGDQHNEACFRNEPSTDVVLRGVECYGSYNGVLGSGGHWLIEDSSFHGNGAGDGQTHNLYLSGNCAELVIRRTESREAIGGHALKSRCAVTTVESTVLRDNTVADAAEFPDGGTVVIRSSTLYQPNGNNGNIVRHGAESCSRPGRLTLLDTVIINDRPQGYVTSACGPITLTGSTVPASVSISDRQ